MKNQIWDVTVKATGEKVRVYMLKQPIDGKTWARYEDGGKTVYFDSELKF
jgi:hypothetical protein